MYSTEGEWTEQKTLQTLKTSRRTRRIHGDFLKTLIENMHRRTIRRLRISELGAYA
jgi:hypothetical protein